MKDLTGISHIAGWSGVPLPDGAHAVAGLLDFRRPLLCGERQALHELDLVAAEVARHDEAQRPAVGERDRFTVHLPGQQAVVERLVDGNGALDDDLIAFEAGGDGLAACGGQVAHAFDEAAEVLDDRAKGHAAPHHAAGGAHAPARAARAVLVVLTPVARALQHRGDGGEAEALEYVDANFAGALHAFDARCPAVAVGDELGRRQGEVLANEQDAAGGEHAGAELLASCFECERVVAVFDEVGRVFAVG